MILKHIDHFIRAFAQNITIYSLLFSAACGSHTGKETDRAIEQKKQDAAHFDTQPTNEIWLTPEQERLADLTTDTARMREVGDELVLNGLLEVPPSIMPDYTHPYPHS